MSAARRMKIKVATADLVKRVEAAKAKAVEQYEADKAAYESKAFPEWRDRCEKALLAAITALQTKGTVPPTGGYRGTHLEVPIKGAPAIRPTKPRLDRFDRDIRLLKMSADAEILVDTESDFAAYL